jgi:glycosyltransferase involved in cell wall biosynthesis
MNIVHLLASPFVGGPERQVLGLARHLPPSYRNIFVSFPEHGLGEAVLRRARADNFDAHGLVHNTPHVGRSAREVTTLLRRLHADVLLCNGYKPDIIGWYAARRLGIPVVSISHGWTGVDWKVRCYEALDRFILRWMDRVICVSAAQAARVRAAGVPEHKIVVIRNAIGEDAFAPPDPAYRDKLLAFFPRPPRLIVGSAGRLSPEKGYHLLVEAARQLVCGGQAGGLPHGQAGGLPHGQAGGLPHDDVGFVHFGDGPLRGEMAQSIFVAGLEDRFILAGFHTDVGKYLPHLDLCVLPSFTEGLPVIVLESFAAGVPVLATAVGGTPEAVDDGITGFLVPPGNVPALAQALTRLLADPTLRTQMGQRGRERVKAEFTFPALSAAYEKVLREIVR